MKLIGLDSSGLVASVAIWEDGIILAEYSTNYKKTHSQTLLPMLAELKEQLDLDEYRQEMQGIYTTSVNENTLDEAPMAYKSLADIIDVIRESVEVIDIMKPIYNYKASE